MAEYCETYEDGSWICYYDDGSQQIGLADGSTVVDTGSTPNPDWTAIAQSGIAAASSILSSRGYSVPVRQPVQTYNGAIPGIQASAGANRAGLGGSLNISTNTLLIGGLILFAFVFGRGRR